MINGAFCPEVEHAPITAEGHFVAQALDRWGVWRRAGMAGAIVGMDIAEAMQAMPQQCDPCFAKRLLVVAESAFCAAVTRAAEGKVETTQGKD